MGVEILMVNDDFKYQYVNTNWGAVKAFLPITAMAVNEDGFLVYGA
jgi:hypothetical protein